MMISLYQQVIILLLGFSSGLPVALTASTLQAWFTEANIDLKTIGMISLLGMPAILRFLWAPLLDYYCLPGFTRRRGWLLLTQLGLVMTISSMAFSTPDAVLTSIPWLFILGLLVSFLSTSQDIVINAYQIEILPAAERGLGASTYVIGWRVGAIVSSALALILAHQYGWKVTYLIMASMMGIGLTATYFAPELAIANTSGSNKNSANLFQNTIAALVEFVQRYRAKTVCLFLLLILTYKAGDALALSLNSTFLLRYMGFDLATVGLVNKTISFISAISGGLVAGLWMTRLSLYHALMTFGFIQGIATLSYALMATVGKKSILLLILTAFTENFCSGMGTIALVALIMSLCNIKYTATQLSLLNSLAFVARTLVGPLAVPMVETLGWPHFFIWCCLLSLPTLIFVYANKQAILALNQHRPLPMK